MLPDKRDGRTRSGLARAEKLDPAERSEIASIAARARWDAKKVRDETSKLASCARSIQ